MKFHHVGYVVEDLQTSSLKFKELGFAPASEVIIDYHRNIKIQFIESKSMLIELISPLNDHSVVKGLVEKYKNIPYHLGFLVDNLQESIAILLTQGYKIIQSPAPAIAFQNKEVVFLYGPNIGIIELIEG